VGLTLQSFRTCAVPVPHFLFRFSILSFLVFFTFSRTCLELLALAQVMKPALFFFKKI